MLVVRTQSSLCFAAALALTAAVTLVGASAELHAEDAPKPAAAKAPGKDSAAKPAAKAAAATAAGKAKPASWSTTAETGSTEKPAEAAAAGAASAQPVGGNVQNATFDDWVLQCAGAANGKQSCALMQRLADPKGRQIVRFTAARTAEKAYLEVSAPLGLSIPFGVALVLPDKSEIKMQLADCNVSGCRAVVPLDEAALTRLKSAERLGVRFQDSKSGKVLTVNGSLKGFAAGIAKVLAAG